MLRQNLPWWARVGAKLVLSRVPVQYQLWRRLGLFQHGGMQDPTYALSVFESHIQHAKLCQGWVGLELGPGDSLASALLAARRGASRCYLVDTGRYADESLETYHALESAIDARGEVWAPSPSIRLCRSLTDYLATCSAQYLTAGLASLKLIPSGSVDFIWSQAVLEHVKAAEFGPVMRELARVLKPEGLCSHRVDLKDHLGGALNNLRTSTERWESPFFANSGFYTNRIRFAEMQAHFLDAGLAIEVISANRWQELPTSRKSMALEFRHLPTEDLLVSGFDVVLRKRAQN